MWGGTRILGLFSNFDIIFNILRLTKFGRCRLLTSAIPMGMATQTEIVAGESLRYISTYQMRGDIDVARYAFWNHFKTPNRQKKRFFYENFLKISKNLHFCGDQGRRWYHLIWPKKSNLYLIHYILLYTLQQFSGHGVMRNSK